MSKLKQKDDKSWDLDPVFEGKRQVIKIHDPNAGIEARKPSA